MKFKDYLILVEQDELSSKKDMKKTLSKIPKEHSDLVKDYKVIFQPSNSLKKDDKHIGLINEKNKTITIAAPWNYGREFTFLHEIAHAVWKYLVDEDKKREWAKIFSSAKIENKSQGEEEMFCMIYAQHYAKNKLQKFENKSLLNFIAKI